MRFESKVVIVTGRAQGIGRGCVEVFHAEGRGSLSWIATRRPPSSLPGRSGPFAPIAPHHDL